MDLIRGPKLNPKARTGFFVVFPRWGKDVEHDGTLRSGTEAMLHIAGCTPKISYADRNLLPILGANT